MAAVSNTALPKKILSAIFGIALGLFVGIFVIGAVIRILFYLIFGWGDSAPFWGLLVESIIIIVSTILSVYYSIKWTMGSTQNE